MKFEELGLSPELLRAVEEAGYQEPTPIQEKTIPYALMGRDILGTAQTGTGKTAAFLLPAIDILHTTKAKARLPRVMILEPTRELAIQLGEAFEIYTKYHEKQSMVVLMGGVSYGNQDQKLMRGIDVIVATPGRLLDSFERGRVMMSDIKYLVIDEADRMMDMGFMPDVERIVGLLPKIRQTMLFSATMPPEIRRLSAKFLSNPKEIAVSAPSSAAETVTQGIAVIDEADKHDALRRLMEAEKVGNALIFCNRKRDVAVLYKSLKKHGFNVEQLHGDMDQGSRTETMEAFRDGKVDLLACSDVAARGLDIQGLSHVFNFDVPMNAEDYIHRIGRTGRAGLPGRAFTLATPDDGRYVQDIEKLIGQSIPMVEIEGFENLAYEESDRRGRRRGGRGAKPERSGSGRSSSGRSSSGRSGSGRASSGGTKSESPKPEQDSPERAKRESPKPERARPERAAGKAAAAKDDSKAKPKRSARPARGEKSDNKQVKGMGEHMPAFMKLPTGRDR